MIKVVNVVSVVGVVSVVTVVECSQYLGDAGGVVSVNSVVMWSV